MTLTFDPRSPISKGSVLSNRLAKTASKSVYLFGLNFVHKKRAGHTHTHTHTDRQTDRQTDTQTNTHTHTHTHTDTILWRCKLDM